ncbi:GDP-mannose 4,6-dehydratase, partial [bacterium]|nr:GDP-mannose 4,6-dehydratase [bacterium]
FENKIDEIYNLACPASPPKYMKDPLHTIRTSLAIDWICKLAKEYDAKILQASTSEVYGDPDLLHHPQNEFYNGNVNIIGPRACYDEGKRIAETILYEYHKLGVKCKIIRIFNTYGPYMDPNDGRVITNFICQALTNKDITVYGDGTQTRSFQYIDDLIFGMTEFMKTDEFGPVNIGNPKEFTINKLADIILELIPESKSKIIYKKLPKDDPIQRKADISKAFSMFGYKPKIELKEGLINTINYLKENI